MKTKQQLMSLFFSFQGGNDHEIYEDSRTIGHKVVSPEDTVQQLTKMFFTQ